MSNVSCTGHNHRLDPFRTWYARFWPQNVTEEDYIYYVKTFMEKILNEIVIRGVKDIEKVNLRKIHGYKHFEHDTGNYNKKDK